MVKFVNALTGSTMYVADNRVEEYKAMGHTIAAPAVLADAADKPAKQEKKMPARKAKTSKE